MNISDLAKNDRVCIRPIQLKTLEAAIACRGVVCAARMGAGKTWLSGALPLVLGALRTLIVVPATGDGREKTLAAFRSYRADWNLVEVYKLMTYNELSAKDGEAKLLNWQPDLIICDEAQNMRRVTHHAGARKIARYMAANQETMFCPLTATLMKYGLADYAHLFAWAFKADSPLPLYHEDIALWARAAAGDEEAIERVRLTPRQIADRIRKHPGVVISDDIFAGVKLIVQPYFVNSGLEKELAAVRKDLVKPDGSPLILGDDKDESPGAHSVASVRRQVGLGFYYVPKPRPPAEYVAARKAYFGIVNGLLAAGHFDTELQVRESLEGKGRARYDRWRAAADAFKYESEPVWLGSDVLAAVANWGQAGGIVWVSHTAFGMALSEYTGWPYYGSGGKNKKGGSILKARARTIICSSKAIGVGHHLIQYHRNLDTNFPSNSADGEQRIGRTFRDGQLEDVTYDILVTCEEHMNAFDKAIELAKLEESQLLRPTVLGLV